MEALRWNGLAREASPPATVVRTTVGEKALVAGSGLVLFGWTCLHLFGTLTVFAGPEVMDGYAGWLRRGAGVPLWGLRVALLGVFVLHVSLVSRLWLRARRARPVGYAGESAGQLAARALRWSSVLLLALIVGHVLHLSFGLGHPELVAERAYANLVRGLAAPAWAVAYVAFAGLFGVHLLHGVRAALVSLGGALGERSRQRLATVVALLLGGGFALIPIAIGLGVLS